ncbi:MAG: tyrosine-type recombinase/integrase [Oscillospiraceae bacterium]|nr:tyrosine-type recombinase/integrase [Oscillospiraceae bacterium]
MQLESLVKEFLFECEIREYSEKTIENYRKQLRHFTDFLDEQFQICELEELNAPHVKLFIKHYQLRQCKPSYVNDNLKAVKVLCAYAYKEKYVDHLITENIKNVKEPKALIHPFSTEEIKKMIAFYHGSSYIEIRNKLILMILFDTGIRINELIEMREEQIQDSYFIIYGKGRKERIVPKNPLVSKTLIKYMTAKAKYFQCRRAEDYLFLSKNGKRLNGQAVNKFMKDCAKAVGVRSMVRVSPHTCRHTFAQQQIKNGLDLYSLSRLLGHESVAITQRYLESIQNSQIIANAKKTSVLSNLK